MAITAILGAQWGDEGKGKVASAIASGGALSARFQGGPNAGHTVWIGDQPVTMRNLPVSALQAGGAVLGSAVALEPRLLVEEARIYCRLTGRSRRSIRISDRAHVLLPRHRAEDSSALSQRIGTSGWGFGPAMTDKYARVGVRVREILEEPTLSGLAGEPLYEFHELLEASVCDISSTVSEMLNAGTSIIAEGAQGASLDIDQGDYPFVTSSTTTVGAIFPSLGVSPRHLGAVVLVASSYLTKLGSGRFPTHFDDDRAKRIQTVGREFDADRGEMRQIGWLDIDQLRTAARLNGCDSLVLTKMDTLGSLPEVEIWEGDRHIATMPGWGNAISAARVWGELPAAATRFIDAVSDLCAVNVGGVSIGRSTDALLWRDDLATNGTQT